MPLLQFNLEVNSFDEAKKIFSKISQNVSSNTFVPLLPDEEHSKDIIGNLTIETPSIFEWQNSGNGQNLVIDYTSENNIFAFLKPQAFLFWPLFAVSIVLKIIALIPAFTFKRVSSKYLIYNYIMFPITLIATIIMVDLANANEGWSFPAFALLIRYVVSLFFQTYNVIRTRDGITIPKKDYEDAKNFKRRFRDLKDYEDTLAAVKGLIHE